MTQIHATSDAGRSSLARMRTEPYLKDLCVPYRKLKEVWESDVTLNHCMELVFVAGEHNNFGRQLQQKSNLCDVADTNMAKNRLRGQVGRRMERS